MRGRMGCRPFLSVKGTVSIDTMLHINDFDGDVTYNKVLAVNNLTLSIFFMVEKYKIFANSREIRFISTAGILENYLTNETSC